MPPWAAVALCCAAAAFEGYDLQAPGVTLPDLVRSVGLAADQRGMFLSISTFGLMLGALIGGRMSDRLGRRVTVVASVCAFGVLALATAFARSADQLLVARFLTGLGLGGALPNLVAIISEITPPHRRFGAIGLLYACLPCGGAVASLVSAGVVHPGGWPLVYALGGVAPLLIAGGLRAILPPLRPPPAEASSRTSVVAALFAEGRAVPTLLLWAAFFAALLALYLLLGWLPSLLVQRGLAAPQAYLVQIAFNLAGALGSAVTGRLLDGRRPLSITSLVFALSYAALAFLAHAPAELAWVILAGGLVGAFVSADQAVIYALAPTLYPNRVRGAGVGTAVAVGRLGSAAGPLVGGVLISSRLPPSHVIIALLPVLIVSGVASVALLALRHPEPPTQRQSAGGH